MLVTISGGTYMYDGGIHFHAYTPCHQIVLMDLRSFYSTLIIERTSGFKYPDDAFQDLSLLTNMHTLQVRDPALNGSGFAHIAELPNLRTIAVSNTNVDDRCVEHIRLLSLHSPLQYLEVHGTSLSHTAIDSLKGIEGLNVIDKPVFD